MMYRPPFINILAFNSAAKHRNFTRSADELNVTQPAISRRVRALEDDLGIKLFDRKTKPLELTPAGETLYNAVSSGLERIDIAIGDIRKASTDKTIIIAAHSGFSAYWLLPRLPKLQAKFPHLRFDIRSNDQFHGWDKASLQVRFGDGQWPNLEAVKIFEEQVFAVCSPTYLQGRPIPFSIEMIKNERLLGLEENDHLWNSWKTWFERLNTPLHQSTTNVTFDSYALLINAALSGQGIALCWGGLLETFLQNGSLIRISEHIVSSNKGYYITFSADALDNAPARMVAKWLSNLA